jgi:hypothetical protein
MTPDEHAEILAGEYVNLGLASGEHHADELVREITSQAVAQAQQYHGRSR